jgi:hypothetical protein
MTEIYFYKISTNLYKSYHYFFILISLICLDKDIFFSFYLQIFAVNYQPNFELIDKVYDTLITFHQAPLFD